MTNLDSFRERSTRGKNQSIIVGEILYSVIEVIHFSKQKNLSLLLISLFVFLLTRIDVEAQEVQIRESRMEGSTIHILYDLLDEDVSRRYTLRLYSSEDNFIKPLEQVTGDIGVNLPVGGNKKLVWDMEKEFGPGYKGKISLELKGQVYVPFVELTGFDYKIMKRGKEYSVTWSGGRGNNVLNLELYRNEERMHVFPNVANVGEYTMVLPKKIKPGNYILKVSDTKNQDDIVYTKQFKIKRKTPVFVKYAAIAGIGAGIYFLTTGFIVPQDNSIPLPPSPE